jgi:hypothetical protein
VEDVGAIGVRSREYLLNIGSPKVQIENEVRHSKIGARAELWRKYLFEPSIYENALTDQRQH